MKFFTRLNWCWHAGWRWLKTFFQMLRGAWRVSRLNGPIVSIFGGSRFLQNDPYALQANELARMFVSTNVSVLTGGGPGIMQAASCGATLENKVEGKGSCIGISVKGLEGKNPCVPEYFEMDYFFARKYLLTHFSTGFVVFPGGLGTLDELAEVITLIHTQKMPRLPVVLIGVEYWKPFLAWLNDQVFKHGAISTSDLELLVITDDLKRALSLVCTTCRISVPKN